jgi:putative PIN family toxin of toxin-antitoxin system
VVCVTADTNIYVSALHFGGVPARFLNEAIAGTFTLAVSEPLLFEVHRVLQTKFLWSDDALTDVLTQLADWTTLVHPARTLAVVAADPDDNRILECAVEACSEYIVSGDNHLLRLGSYGGIRIVRVAGLWASCRSDVAARFLLARLPHDRRGSWKSAFSSRSAMMAG